jgi:hypothetical protein
MRPTRNTMVWQAAAVMALAALGGCGSGVEAAQNPQTGETVTCTGSQMSDMSPWSQRDACIADHVAQGWTVKMKSGE